MPTAPSPAPARPGPTTAPTTRTQATDRRRANDGAAAAATGAAPTTAAGTGTPDRSTTAKTTRRGTGPTPRPAPPGQSGAAAPATGSSDARVQAALAHGHDLTVPEIAQTTGLGKSTVAKALNRLAAAGQATRIAGSGSGVTRTPDRWNLAADTHPSTGTGSDAGSGASTGPASAAATHDRSEASRAAGSPAAPKPKRAASTGRTETAARGASAPAEPAAPAEPTAPAQPTARTGSGTDAGAGNATRNPVTGTVKLTPGALTRQVAGHFAGHPDTALTAGEVGRALARSGGAVRNACEKLVRDGDLRLVSDSPRRYTLSTAVS